MIGSKSQLAILLSQLKGFENPKVEKEQYNLDSEIAADMLWNAYLIGDLVGKVSDLGCGTGILGIGVLLLEAKKCYFVDSDKEVLAIARHNIEQTGVKVSVNLAAKAEFLLKDVKNFTKKADVVVQNPPFGTKVRHADKEFLEKAMQLSKVIYSVHKTTSKGFIQALCKDRGFEITNIWYYKLPLKATLAWHKKRVHYVDVACFRLEKGA